MTVITDTASASMSAGQFVSFARGLQAHPVLQRLSAAWRERQSA
jgi:hypothetical protein